MARREVYERGNATGPGAASAAHATNVTLRTDAACGTVRVDISAAPDGASARGWLLRLHLTPGQRVTAASVDGRFAAGTMVILPPRVGYNNSEIYFPLRGAGTPPPHRAGPIAELRLPRAAGPRSVIVVIAGSSPLSSPVDCN